MSLFRPKLWQIPEPSEKERSNLAEKSTELAHRLRQIADNHASARFASSLAAEDMLIADMIAKNNLNIQIFTLETGKLHKETLELLDHWEQRYANLPILRFYPVAESVEKFTAEHGRDPYYESIELRKKCCFIRKIEPLNRALAGADAWLTGQRREQSVTRTELAFAERDKTRNMAKYNPIFDWSEREVWAYVLAHNVPYNRLYHQGFPSIGCDPCTRPVKEGEDIRAGRWWWENKDSKECGLHVTNLDKH